MSRETEGPPVASGRPEVGDEVVAKRRDPYTPDSGSGPTADEVAARCRKLSADCADVFVFWLVLRHEISRLFRTPLGRCAAAALSTWRREFASTRPLCIGCDAEVRDKYAPGAFLFIVPGRDDPGVEDCAAACAAVCVPCSKRDARELATAATRAIGPGTLRFFDISADGGRA